MLTEKQLDDIAWRAGRGCHYEDVFLHGSNYAKQVIQNDVPLLIAEIRRLQAAQPTLAPDGLTEEQKMVNALMDNVSALKSAGAFAAGKA